MRSRRRWHWPHQEHYQLITRADYSVVASVLLLAVGIFWLTSEHPRPHALLLNIPVESSLDEAFEPWPADLPVHRLVISRRNSILLDGVLVSRDDLDSFLHSRTQSAEVPGLLYVPEGDASYELSVRILQHLIASGATKERFCLGGLKQHADVADEAQWVQRARHPNLSGPPDTARVARDAFVTCDGLIR